jgi:hypothetical protein
MQDKQYINMNASILNIVGYTKARTGFWWGNLKERDHWGDPGVDGRIIL